MEDLTASLFQSGSMDLVGSNSSAVNGFALGALPSGDYILRANASFGRSYTVDYFGIRQIESANYTEGSIRITIGSPTTQEASFTNGAESISGIESETWPLTLSSPSVITGVNLTSISIIDQAYVEFFPSYLPELGPSGATVSMLVAGAGAPSSVYSSDGVNVSMIIQATATSGSTGEVGLPMVVSGTGAGFIVLHSLASRQEVVGSAMTIPQGGFPPFDTEAIIYDPPVATNQSLPITISITGLYNSNGSLLPPSASPLIYVLPSTLNQSLIPYEPLYFALYGLTNGTTHTAPVGSYILVVDVQMGSASLTLFVPVQVIPPIPALDGPVEQMP